MSGPDVKQLTALARGLSGMADLAVVIGDNSHFDPSSRKITIDREYVYGTPSAISSALVSHEVGHVLISRYFLWEPRLEPAPAWWHLLNALEDPRSDLFMQRRYPGSSAWYDALYDLAKGRAKATPKSHFLQFAIAACSERMFPLVDWNLVQSVQKALRKTRAVRARLWQAVPPSDLRLVSPPPHEARRLRSPDKRATDAREAMVIAWAGYALSIIERQILPVVEPLLLRDLACVAAMHTALVKRGVLSEACSPSQLSRFVPQALGNYKRVRRAAFVFLAPAAKAKVRDAFGIFLTGSGKNRSSALPGPGGFPSGPGVREDPARTNADEVFRKVGSQADDLSRAVTEALRPLTRNRSVVGFDSGRRIDIPGYLRFKADRRDHRFWRRHIAAHRIDAAVSLLVDLSGSMAGEKTEAATGGSFLLAEALSHNNVPFEINGFQDVLIPFARFIDSDMKLVRSRIAEMPLEVVGERPDGNNQPSHNDDGPCLTEAARALLAAREKNKLMIVISDGLPNGRRSDQADLHKAVAAVSAMAGIKLIGLGLGPETEHVRDFYPHAISNIPLERIGTEIGNLLIRLCGELAQ